MKKGAIEDEPNLLVVIRTCQTPCKGQKKKQVSKKYSMLFAVAGSETSIVPPTKDRPRERDKAYVRTYNFLLLVLML